MEYFLDTEFIEDGKTIDLISIGIVAEDGRELYAINKECDFSKASWWVVENVLQPMGLDHSGFNKNPGDPSVSPSYRNSCLAAHPKGEIACLVKEFVRDSPEFWAYYAGYDWVAVCQLFGTMMDLPEGFPTYCRDIKQECDRLGNTPLPKQAEGEHNALADARWNKQAREFLKTYARKSLQPE